MVLLEGKQLFNTHCGSCHSLCQQRIGPPLAGVTDRRPVSWLFDFIASSQKVIQNGDPYAGFLYQQYNNAIMPDFNFLSQEKVLAILGYINAASSAPSHIAGVNGRPLRDAQELKQPGEFPLQGKVTAMEDEQEGSAGTKYLILKVVIFVVATLSMLAHILYVASLWKKGKAKFRI
ncbi:Cytochrome c3 [Fulvivirga imtechensis AK7]|uniref:Cytochrome c3 n=2 Tax=Fulvivirga TaxID=396811 RepID=L8JQF5_9BACT|nr:Cytochrome c3 [Fulvivirga imtechensis AK7]